MPTYCNQLARGMEPNLGSDDMRHVRLEIGRQIARSSCEPLQGGPISEHEFIIESSQLLRSLASAMKSFKLRNKQAQSHHVQVKIVEQLDNDNQQNKKPNIEESINKEMENVPVADNISPDNDDIPTNPSDPTNESTNNPAQKSIQSPKHQYTFEEMVNLKIPSMVKPGEYLKPHVSVPGLKCDRDLPKDRSRFRTDLRIKEIIDYYSRRSVWFYCELDDGQMGWYNFYEVLKSNPTHLREFLITINMAFCGALALKGMISDSKKRTHGELFGPMEEMILSVLNDKKLQDKLSKAKKKANTRSSVDFKIRKRSK